ncbi:hypothetical protein [Deinococcus murrayi]|uniref:hypothetical protein n=1 Tax=Deinococcus murrayi TaxID=68910 RepID=UPI00047F1A20|nr:hypothetical protein [Deinococcus murrayi]
MTRDDNDQSSTQTEKFQPDTTADLSDQEAAELNAGPRRGARQEPGAHPSDDAVQKRVQGTASGTPNIPDIGPNTGKH